MGSMVSGLFGGGDEGGGRTSTNTVQVPKWLDSRNKSLVSRADNLSQQSYTPYTDPRIANFTGDTNAAFDMTRNNTGQFSDLFSSASTGVYDLMGRANGPSSGQIQQYMNPYLDNVLDVSKRNTIQDYNQQQQLRDQEAGMINAFGGSRVGVRQSMADQDLAQNLQDLDYTGRFDAFNNAQNQFNRGTDVLSTGISQGLQTGMQGQQYNQQDITQLLKQGELQRLREQDQLDFNYQEFDREQAYPYENINFLANVMNPLTGAYAGGTTTQDSGSSGGGSDTLGNIAGIASSAASILPLLGLSDERLKENIRQVGELENGLPIYSYNFKGNPKTEIGLIAQEVEQEKPETVFENEDGIKMVNYEEAVKLRDGGPVSANTASQARLAPVASAGRGSFPGAVTPAPSSSGIPAIDGMGLESLIGDFNDSEFSFINGDGNAISRLFKGGLDGIDSSNYGSPIGPTLSPNTDGFNGLGGSGGSFLSAFGFKDGGAASKSRLSGVSSTPMPGAFGLAEELGLPFKGGFMDIMGDLGIGSGGLIESVMDNGLSGGAIGGLSDMLGFKDGGAVKEEDFWKNKIENRKELMQRMAEGTPQYPIDPETQSGAGMLGRRALNFANQIPATAASVPLALNNISDRAAQAVAPVGDAVADWFTKPVGDIEAEKQQRVQQNQEQAVSDQELNSDIATLLGRGNANVPFNQPQDVVSAEDMGVTPPKSMEGRPLTVADLKNFDPKNIPALNSSELNMDSNGKIIPASSVSYNRPINQPNEFMESQGRSQLPPWITPINKDAGRTKEEPRSKGINMPLLLAGLTMLGTDGNSGDKLLAGLGAGTQYAGQQKRNEIEQAKNAADLKRQEFQDYIDYIKAQAYIEQVQQNARKGDGLTPYQQASIDLKRDKLSLDREKMENKIKGEDNNDPFADLDISGIEEILGQLGN